MEDTSATALVSGPLLEGADLHFPLQLLEQLEMKVMAAQWSVPIERGGILEGCCLAYRQLHDAGKKPTTHTHTHPHTRALPSAFQLAHGAGKARLVLPFG